MIFGIMSSISGCEDNKKELSSNTERMITDELTAKAKEDVTEASTEKTSVTSFDTENSDEETTVEAMTDGIFYWSSEDYFYLLEGRWKAVEYAGAPNDSHDLSTEEDFWEKKQEYTNEVIEENLGREFNITRDNLESCGPYGDLTIVMEDYVQLRLNTGFASGIGENTSLTPPFIGLSVRLADEEEKYWFIVDEEGTVLVKMDHRFFRLERIEEREVQEESVEDYDMKKSQSMSGMNGFSLI